MDIKDDNTFSSVVTLPAILFCLGVYLATYVVDLMLAESCKKYPGFCEWWKKAGLPSFPIIFGGIVAFFLVDYPYPDIVRVHSVRIMFGAGCGFFSTSVVQILKGALAAKANVKEAREEAREEAEAKASSKPTTPSDPPAV